MGVPDEVLSVFHKHARMRQRGYTNAMQQTTNSNDAPDARCAGMDAQPGWCKAICVMVESPTACCCNSASIPWGVCATHSALPCNCSGLTAAQTCQAALQVQEKCMSITAGAACPCKRQPLWARTLPGRLLSAANLPLQQPMLQSSTPLQC